VRDVLGELNRSLGKLYASEGRPSIPPEQLLSALLLQVFYGIRSERQLMEQLNYNLLYRWFVGLSPDDPIWDPTTFTKNRDALVPLCQGMHDHRTSNSRSWPGEKRRKILLDPRQRAPI
jgi:transposase